LAPACGVLVPRGLSSHASGLVPPMSRLYRPAGQTLDVLLVLPSPQKWPSAHGPLHSRLVWPGVAPYLPAAHGSGVEVPREHAKPSGQASQPSAEARSAVREKVPAGPANKRPAHEVGGTREAGNRCLRAYSRAGRHCRVDTAMRRHSPHQPERRQSERACTQRFVLR
jgi:hypothetical protein